MNFRWKLELKESSNGKTEDPSKQGEQYEQSTDVQFVPQTGHQVTGLQWAQARGENKGRGQAVLGFVGGVQDFNRCLSTM